MTTTVRFRAETAAPTPDGQHGRLATPPGVRDRRQLAVGLLLAVGSALAFWAWHNGQGGRRPMLAVVHPVGAGEVVQAGDLATVRVTLAGGIRAVPATRRGTVVGRRAAVDLVPGTLLSPAELGPARRVAAGRAVTGVALKAGQFPDGLRAGDVVMVLRAAPGTASTADGPGSAPLPLLASAARVVTVGGGRDPMGTTLVSLEVDATQAPAVATASAAGQVSLVLVGG